MKKIFNNKIWFGLTLFIFFLILIPNLSLAQEVTSSGYVKYPSGWEIIPNECLDPKTTDANGIIIRCDVNSFIQLFVNLAFIMLKLSPPLAMVIIIYGGFRLLTSRGKQESVQTGKKILSSVFIGMFIIIVLGWTATFFIVRTLTGVKTGKLFQNVTNITSVNWWGGSSGGTGGDGDNLPGLQCCVVQGKGCLMKTTSDCTALGGAPDPNVTNCIDNVMCLTIDAEINCCMSSDASGNGSADVCYTVVNNLAGCLQYPETTASANNQPCAQDGIVCDREL